MVKYTQAQYTKLARTINSLVKKYPWRGRPSRIQTAIDKYGEKMNKMDDWRYAQGRGYFKTPRGYLE